MLPAQCARHRTHLYSGRKAPLIRSSSAIKSFSSCLWAASSESGALSSPLSSSSVDESTTMAFDVERLRAGGVSRGLLTVIVAKRAQRYGHLCVDEPAVRVCTVRQLHAGVAAGGGKQADRHAGRQVGGRSGGQRLPISLCLLCERGGSALS